MPVHALRNAVKHYAWGSRTALPELLRAPNPEDLPWAELWIGAHARGSSEVEVAGRWLPLRDWIAADPAGTLGADLAERFGGELPFLVKLLAVAQPLSLQVHPDAAGAAAGFAREEAAGVALDAPERSYPDPHPKPELLVALGPFEALCGLRPIDEIRATLESAGAPRLSALLAPVLAKPDARPGDVLAHLLQAERGARGAAIAELAERSAARGADATLRRVAALAELHPGDAGVAAPLLLHHIELAEGDALFLGAGVLHGYLSGLALELQASSDNVLRGALTPKHVDVEELLRVVTRDALPLDRPAPRPGAAGTLDYRVDTKSFRLSAVRVSGSPVRQNPERGAEILLCTAGAVEVGAPGAATIPLQPGDAAFVTGVTEAYDLRGDGRIHRVTAGI